MAGTYHPRGKYLEEFVEGVEEVSQGRTVTEADLVEFAALTWDHNPMHTDAEYGKTTPFGERVAHGVMGLSYAVGLAWGLGFMDGTVIAFTGLEWKFKGPIKVGDTIHLTAKVKQTRPMKAMGGGMVIFDVRVRNQRDEVVQQGEWTALVKSKPAES